MLYTEMGHFMDQAAFSKHVHEYLLKHHPQFLETLEYLPDGSLECSLSSPTGKFNVWIATFNTEVTIGMLAPEQIQGAHTHLSGYGNEVEDQTEAMTEYLNDIFMNKLIFIHSSIRGYTWTNDLTYALMNKKSHEAIEFYTWTGEV